jgi:hypothetical protein
MSNAARFCASCFNLVSGCDCYDDLEDYRHLTDLKGNDLVKEDDSTWYFLGPVDLPWDGPNGPLIQSILMSRPELWTTEKPVSPFPPLSIPQERLDHMDKRFLNPSWMTAIDFNGSSYMKHDLKPWEMNFYNVQKSGSVFSMDNIPEHCMRYKGLRQKACIAKWILGKAKEELNPFVGDWVVPDVIWGDLDGFKSPDVNIPDVTFDKYHIPIIAIGGVALATLLIPDAVGKWNKAPYEAVKGRHWNWIEEHLATMQDPVEDEYDPYPGVDWVWKDKLDFGTEPIGLFTAAVSNNVPMASLVPPPGPALAPPPDDDDDPQPPKDIPVTFDPPGAPTGSETPPVDTILPDYYIVRNVIAGYCITQTGGFTMATIDESRYRQLPHLAWGVNVPWPANGTVYSAVPRFIVPNTGLSGEFVDVILWRMSHLTG